mmetsp:Transcript_3043/g.5452  ORF Transcript_3043/g.5452 Transcript_3043/m.5452 type:complete len:313 (-) Transcript_3043:86-1024(-)
MPSPKQCGRPDNPSPSPVRASMIAQRKRRTLAMYSSNDYSVDKSQNSPTMTSCSNVYVEDVHIAAAVKLHRVEQSEADYYVSRVKEIANLRDFDIPSYMLHEVTRGVELKCTKEGTGSGKVGDDMHYMTCSEDYLRRQQKPKAIMKRPPSLAPLDSPIYQSRRRMKERQLEARTVIEQKINQVFNYLQNDPQHIKYISSKKNTLKHSTDSYKRSLQIRLMAATSVRQYVEQACTAEVERYKERNKAKLRLERIRREATTVVTKNWRRYIVMKERRRVLEAERLIEEAEEKIRREKEKAFLERMKIKMSLLQL